LELYFRYGTLVQDATHGNLLRKARQQLRAQIADALEDLSPEITESQPELLVHQPGTHPKLVAQAHLAIVLFCLGFPDQTLAQSRAAIAEAQQLAHPRSLAVTLALGSRLLVLVGDDATLSQRADELAGVATEQGFAVGAQGTLYHGWVKVKQHDLTEGMSLLRAGLADYRAGGADLWMSHFLALLAEACETAGKIEEGRPCYY